MKNIAIITGASSGIGKEFLLNMPKNIEVDEISRETLVDGEYTCRRKTS